MNKPCLEVTVKNKVVFVGIVHDVDSNEYYQKKKEAEKNLNDLIEGFQDVINVLRKEIVELKKEVKHLKGED